MSNLIDNIVNGVVPGLEQLNEKANIEAGKPSVPNLAVGPAPLRYESVTEARDQHSGARIRVWRKSAELPEYNDVEIQLVINKIPGRATMKQVYGYLSAIEGVTKVELTDANGLGAVAFFE